jgi:hypothetical protein
MAAMTMAFPVRDDPGVVSILVPAIASRPHSCRRSEVLARAGAHEGIRADALGERARHAARAPAPAREPASLPAPDPNLPAPNKGIAVGEAAPDFTLTDQTGHAVGCPTSAASRSR